MNGASRQGGFVRALGWLVLAAILLLAAAASFAALRYGLWLDGEPGPGLFPLLACALIVAGVLAALLEPGGHPVPAEVPPEEEARPTPRRLLATMATVIAWGLLLQPLGYAVSSGLALLILLLAGGVGRGASAAIAAGAVLGTELLFVRLLDVPLPGPAWF